MKLNENKPYDQRLWFFKEPKLRFVRWALLAAITVTVIIELF